MFFSGFFAVALLAEYATAKFCGVGTSPVKSYQPCDVDQYPAMDAACKSIGGSVAGHLQEQGNANSNCVTYCNNVRTGGHDITGTTKYNEHWRLLVVDPCRDCPYCGYVTD